MSRCYFATFLRTGLASLAACLAFSDIREFLAFFLAIRTNLSDHLGERRNVR